MMPLLRNIFMLDFTDSDSGMYGERRPIPSDTKSEFIGWSIHFVDVSASLTCPDTKVADVPG